jgi:predicted  nucleic acid-binding Zn-ribbon protein
VTTKEHFSLLDRQMAAHTKQIKAIRELVHEGMRLIVATRKDMRALAAMQREVRNAPRRGSNGHSKKKIDLQ